jgi:hypothetical protein
MSLLISAAGWGYLLRVLEMDFQVVLADCVTNSIGCQSASDSDSDSDLDFRHLARGLGAEVVLIPREYL